MVEEVCDCHLGITTTAEENDDGNERVTDYVYGPTSYHFLDMLFSRFPFQESDHLIDFGCGKGRVMFMAAHHGCKYVSGCEINASRRRILDNNIMNYQNRFGTDAIFDVCADSAEKMDIARTANKFFFFSPFHLKLFIKTMNRIMQSLENVEREISIYLYRPYISTIEYLDHIPVLHKNLYYECTLDTKKGTEQICLFAVYHNLASNYAADEESAAWII